MDGLNPGEYVQQYIDHLNPELDVFFQTPNRISKKFNIHSNECQIYYEKSKVGPNQTPKMLPNLCEALGLPRSVNAQMRPTMIRKMSKARFNDREIMDVTRHKKSDTLRHYDSAPDNKRKLERSMAILSVKKKKPTSSAVSRNDDAITTLEASEETVTNIEANDDSVTNFEATEIITVADIHEPARASTSKVITTVQKEE